MITKKVKMEMTACADPTPVAMLVQVASQYKSKIYLECDNKKVNAKSIMGMMSLALGTGDHVTLIAEGTDEGEALDKIESYLIGA